MNADLNALSSESESLSANLVSLLFSIHLNLIPKQPAITSKQSNNSTDHKSNEEKRLDEIELVMITLQSSLDVLTGYCSQIPEGDFELNDTEDNEAEEMEDEMQEDIDAIIEGDSNNQENGNEMDEVKPVATTSIIPSSLLTLFNPEVELHNKLIKLAYPTSMSLLRSSISATSPHSPTTAHLSVVHLRALEALQNLLLSLARYAPSPSSPTSEQEAEAWSSLKQQLNPTLSRLWAGLFEIGQAIEPCEVNSFTIRTQSARFGCIENLVGCMLGVSKVLGEDLQLQSSEITALINMYNASTSGALKSKVVGTLGGLARRQDKIEDNRIIGNFLIDLLNKLPHVASQATDESTTAEVAIAILNELFDIYADENSGYDVPVFRNDQFLNKLRAVVPLVRTCVCSNSDLRMSLTTEYRLAPLIESSILNLEQPLMRPTKTSSHLYGIDNQLPDFGLIISFNSNNIFIMDAFTFTFH